MNLWRSMGGMVRATLTSADPGNALAEINSRGITVFDAAGKDDGIVSEFSVRRQDVPSLRRLAKKKGYGLTVTRSAGIYWTVKNLLHRPVLVLSLILFCVLGMYLPSRVLFIRIEGNSTVPTRLILEKCAECGISFGASRSGVRSETVKNALLEAIPQLQWAGVNTSGCVATVTVRERTDAEKEESSGGVCSIVAACDGVITECTVIRGNRLCRVGQAVRAGDVLVSGYTDCGLCIQATRAEAEIYARTQRELTAITPTIWTRESENRVTEKKYALIIGKKRINFYKGSGISGTSCDKIYSEYYITLPGGFTLPVAVVTEAWTYADETRTVQTDESVLTEFAQRYLTQQMTAGSILSGDAAITEADGVLLLQGNYACTEMIARVRNEEIIKPYGNDN